MHFLRGHQGLSVNWAIVFPGVRWQSWDRGQEDQQWPWPGTAALLEQSTLTDMQSSWYQKGERPTWASFYKSDATHCCANMGVKNTRAQFYSSKGPRTWFLCHLVEEDVGRSFLKNTEKSWAVPSNILIQWSKVRWRICIFNKHPKEF
jgi:hypothetical protein